MAHLFAPNPARGRAGEVRIFGSERAPKVPKLGPTETERNNSAANTRRSKLRRLTLTNARRRGGVWLSEANSHEVKRKMNQLVDIFRAGVVQNRAVVLSVACAVAACSGTIEHQPAGAEASLDESNGPTGEGKTSGSSQLNGGNDSPATPGPLMDCSEPNPGSAPLRRLSNFEYQNTVLDLFAEVDGMEALVENATGEFPAEPQSLGFHNNAQLLVVQPLLAQKYLDAAEAIAAHAAQSSELLPCAPEPGDEMSCARMFIAEFGRRVYRRALTNEERARYEALFEEALAEHDFPTAVEWVLFTWLQSPQFLYRVERGHVGTGGAAVPLTPDELATRLAYLFWQSTPDWQLLERANEMGLQTPEAVATLAREMLEDERADRLFRFFVEWLDLDRLEEFQRDASVFPELPQTLPEWFEQETRSLVRELLGRADGSFEELLTAPYTYVNPPLARHYGLPEPTSERFERVEAPDRSGILTQAMMLSHDKPYRSSIVNRGLKIRTDLLCQNVPAPPDDVPLDLDGTAGAQSQRARLEQHRRDPNCSGCHTLIDPIGIVFERFDAVGRYRDVDEQGEFISTESELRATLDADGPVADVRELGSRLAQSQQVQDCYITQTFRFFFGREVEAADGCSMARMREAFADSDQSLSELLIAVTQTDAFLYRPIE